MQLNPQLKYSSLSLTDQAKCLLEHDYHERACGGKNFRTTEDGRTDDEVRQGSHYFSVTAVFTLYQSQNFALLLIVDLLELIL